MKGQCILAVFILSFVALSSCSSGGMRPAERRNKAGVGYLSHDGALYTIYSKSTNSANEATAPIMGPVLFYERIIWSRIALELKYSSLLERNLSFSLDGKNINILENISFYSAELRSYTRNHLWTGLKPFFGISYGNYTSESDIRVIQEDGTVVSEQMKSSTPVNFLNMGFDYIIGNEVGDPTTGIRFKVGTVFGKRDDVESNDNYYSSHNYEGLFGNVTVFIFF